VAIRDFGGRSSVSAIRVWPSRSAKSHEEMWSSCSYSARASLSLQGYIPSYRPKIAGAQRRRPARRGDPPPGRNAAPLHWHSSGAPFDRRNTSAPGMGCIVPAQRLRYSRACSGCVSRRSNGLRPIRLSGDPSKVRANLWFAATIEPPDSSITRSSGSASNVATISGSTPSACQQPRT
jgi:hypothetical protein